MFNCAGHKVLYYGHPHGNSGHDRYDGFVHKNEVEHPVRVDRAWGPASEIRDGKEGVVEYHTAASTSNLECDVLYIDTRANIHNILPEKLPTVIVSSHPIELENHIMIRGPKCLHVHCDAICGRWTVECDGESHDVRVLLDSVVLKLIPSFPCVKPSMYVNPEFRDGYVCFDLGSYEFMWCLNRVRLRKKSEESTCKAEEKSA